MKSALSDEDDEGASHVDFELGRSSLRYVPMAVVVGIENMSGRGPREKKMKKNCRSSSSRESWHSTGRLWLGGQMWYGVNGIPAAADLANDYEAAAIAATRPWQWKEQRCCLPTSLTASHTRDHTREIRGELAFSSSVVRPLQVQGQVQRGYVATGKQRKTDAKPSSCPASTMRRGVYSKWLLWGWWPLIDR